MSVQEITFTPKSVSSKSEFTRPRLRAKAKRPTGQRCSFRRFLPYSSGFEVIKTILFRHHRHHQAGSQPRRRFAPRLLSAAG
jgi:hypothetical protein